MDNKGAKIMDNKGMISLDPKLIDALVKEGGKE